MTDPKLDKLYINTMRFLAADPVHNPAILATATLTLALPKTGLRASTAAGHVGELYLADIGVPPELYTGPTLGLEVGPVFSKRRSFV